MIKTTTNFDLDTSKYNPNDLKEYKKTIYDEQFVQELLEDDELSADEALFMQGYTREN
ncbi:MAG: hypothetical protein ACQESC_01915 [Nanobdellota archaeon]